MEIHEDSLRKTFTLERQLACFITAVARRELSYKEVRDWMENHVQAMADEDSESLNALEGGAFLVLYEADYHGDEETIIRGFCRLARLPYHQALTSSNTVYVEMTFP